MPTVFDIDAIRNDAFSHDIDSSDYAPGKRGSDHSEVFQLRPYEQGDSLKQVHWKASCKFDDLIVRDASFPIVRSLLICMDVSGCTAAECDAISDVAVSVCSALSDSGTAFTIARPQCGQIEFIDVNASDELPSAAEWLIECEPSESAFAAYVRERGACGYGKSCLSAKSSQTLLRSFAPVQTQSGFSAVRAATVRLRHSLQTIMLKNCPMLTFKPVSYYKICG